MLTTEDNETGILTREGDKKDIYILTMEDIKSVCLQERIMKQGYFKGE
jgi:hypothetical protein